MKKLLQGIVLTCTFTTAPVMAQTVNYACQYIVTAGLNWENGRWVVSEFHNRDPFILTAINEKLVPPEITSEQQLSHPLAFAECREPTAEVTGLSDDHPVKSRVQFCDSGGSVLAFSFGNLTGTASELLGGAAARENNYKDSVFVSPFVCEKIR